MKELWLNLRFGKYYLKANKYMKFTLNKHPLWNNWPGHGGAKPWEKCWFEVNKLIGPWKLWFKSKDENK